MKCFIVTQKITGEIYVLEFDDFIVTCTNTGHGPYSTLPTTEIIQEIVDSKAWLPSYEELEAFEYENVMILLYKISVMREKAGIVRNPTLH